MTQEKREPFARVEPFTSATWAISVGGHIIRAGFKDRQTVEERAERINAANEARVKEAVREAVKEAKACRECGGTDAVCLRGHNGAMNEMRKSLDERDARLAELERVLDRVSLYASQLLVRWDLHGLGRGDEQLIENFRSANKEIKSVLGKGE